MKIRAGDQRGFTLIELVVVIAILGVLAAVTVPLVTNYLNSAKQRSYSAEQERIQQAVDAYYSAPDNTKYRGKAQYPIIGKGQTSQSALLAKTSSVTYNDNSNPFAPYVGGVAQSAATWNPLGGTQGADLTTKWADANTDGVRTTSNTSADTWTSVSVTAGASTYYVDPRYYFIDFESMVTAGLLNDTPQSASADNKPSGSTQTYSGSYSWYVDNNGKVKSVYKELASTAGFVTGVFP